MLTLAKIQVPTEAPLFDERKATEAGIHFIHASGGRQLLLKVLAMMYIADRRLIEKSGRGLTDDDYLAVGGVLAVPSGLLDHAGKVSLFSSTWHRHVEGCAGNKVKILSEIEPKVLSHAEIAVVEQVATEFAGLNDKEFFQAFRREAPEVAEIGKGHFTIKNILVALGDDPEESSAFHEQWASERRVRFGRNSLVQ